jgi:hexosaminidase
MTWPRAFALAEALWSTKESRNWDDFSRRVEQHFERMDAAQVKYSPSIYDPIITVSKKDTATIVVKLETEINGLNIHYSFDNSFPDNFYPNYKEPLTVPKDAATFKLITYRNNKPQGRMMVLTMAELRKRAGLK